MPGYVIHLAVAKEYIRKHNDIENKEKFIEGIMYPDSVKDKSQTHYGPNSANSDLTKFLKEHKILSDFEKGYFIHLISDYLFYRNFKDLPDSRIYDDYDILNNLIIEEYDIQIPEQIKNIVGTKVGKLTYLSMDLVKNYIENVSSRTIDEYIEEINGNPKKWLEFK